MIVTNNDYLADKIRSLRSHGWTRDMKSTKQYNKFSSTIDPRFLFVNVGYNLRSSDLNASIGIEQLKKLKKFNQSRHDIGNLWNNAFQDLKNNGHLKPMEITKNTKASWFGFCFM